MPESDNSMLDSAKQSSEIVYLVERTDCCPLNSLADHVWVTGDSAIKGAWSC
jgi:hypothetical protein